jgi:iron complex transport system substrate-binding protein
MKNISHRLISLVLVLIILVSILSGCTQNAQTTTSTSPTTQATSASQTTMTTTQSTTQTTSIPQTTSVSGKRQVKNLDGTIIEVPSEVTRVACLLGPSYEKVVMLGAEDKIVLTSTGYINGSVWPWSNLIYKRTSQVQGIDNANNPNMETLMQIKPDVVFFWGNKAVTDKMLEIGIPSVYPPPEANSGVTTFDQTKDFLMVYAQALGGNAVSKAEEYAKYFDQKKAMVVSRTKDIPDSERPTVYYAVRVALATSGKDCSSSELVSLAGGTSVTKDLPGGLGTNINVEQLMTWNPQYIVIDHCGSKALGSAPADQILTDIAKDPRFSTIAAVKNNNVYMSPTGVFFWDSGCQMILQLVWLAKMLHPDKFQDINMVTELKEYYTKFLNYNLTDEQANKILLHLPPN